uniref:Uncharacterized protein n=1 Tax=virus sp. ctBM815 TaxID=2825806 RepID=A0A8S5RK95_9VIRU|nr:MAG TPA: hypothetical protein [virus sp. ctBM815]DAV23988.1 MAG TPA: hypothetical protein [Bacteriophage sp.]
MIIRCWEIKIYESCLIQISSLVPIISKHYCISRNNLYTFFLLNKIYRTKNCAIFFIIHLEGYCFL